MTYLMRKNYDIELALALIIVDLDDLVKLIRSQDKKLEQNLKLTTSKCDKFPHIFYDAQSSEILMFHVIVLFRY